MNLETRILHEDDTLLIIDKPFGLPTSGKSLDDDDCLQYHVMQHQQGMVWAIHQLDADTTGINVFCKVKKQVYPLKCALENENTQKIYTAIVHGHTNWHNHHVRAPIGKIDERNLGVTDSGKACHSLFNTLSSHGDFSLVQVRLFTGRTHQIRIHSAHLGHSLLGEEWYIPTACQAHPRQALHAQELILHTGEHFRCPLAEDLRSFCKTHELDLKQLESSEANSNE